MATNIIFNLIDCLSNPLTGSKVSIKPYNGPFLSGSCIAFTGPSINYTDNVSGSVAFNNVVSGIYKTSFSNAGAVNMANGGYYNFDNTGFYISVPELSGSTVNGSNLIITSYTNTNTASFAYTIQAANNLFALQYQNNPNLVESASYAVSSSYALNGGSAGSSPNLTTSSLYLFDSGLHTYVTLSMYNGSLQIN